MKHHIDAEKIKASNFYNKLADSAQGERFSQKQCQHSKLKPPNFDKNKAKGQSSEWVRKHYSRKVETCPDCGSSVILYASEEHYILGDW